jgi:hypothetical protein
MVANTLYYPSLGTVFTRGTRESDQISTCPCLFVGMCLPSSAEQRERSGCLCFGANHGSCLMGFCHCYATDMIMLCIDAVYGPSSPLVYMSKEARAQTCQCFALFSSLLHSSHSVRCCSTIFLVAACSLLRFASHAFCRHRCCSRGHDCSRPCHPRACVSSLLNSHGCFRLNIVI